MARPRHHTEAPKSLRRRAKALDQRFWDVSALTPSWWPIASNASPSSLWRRTISREASGRCSRARATAVFLSEQTIKSAAPWSGPGSQSASAWRAPVLPSGLSRSTWRFRLWNSRRKLRKVSRKIPCSQAAHVASESPWKLSKFRTASVNVCCTKSASSSLACRSRRIFLRATAPKLGLSASKSRPSASGSPERARADPRPNSRTGSRYRPPLEAGEREMRTDQPDASQPARRCQAFSAIEKIFCGRASDSAANGY